MTPHTIRRAPNGFTLIELMIALAIMGILASTALNGYQLAMCKVKYGRVMKDMESIVTAVQANKIDNEEKGGNGVWGNWAADVLPNTLPPDLASYLKEWPTPPCAGWKYDWDELAALGGIRNRPDHDLPQQIQQ